MNKLEGKTALITGGSTGIGLATAKQFVDEGAYVFITGRREPELAAAVSGGSRGGGQTAGKPRRLRVNAVSRGLIDTPPWHATQAAEQAMNVFASSVPLGRFGTPDEVAKAVVFLASNDSSYVTGTELFVDGGFAQV